MYIFFLIEAPPNKTPLRLLSYYRTMTNVLIVDDTPANLLLLKTLLKACGCAPQDFLSPAACLTSMVDTASHTDLAILDYQMPEMDGDALAAALREIGCDCHIILLTAFSELSLSDLNQKARISAVMNKPFSINDIRYMLKRWSDRTVVSDARKEIRTGINDALSEQAFIYVNGSYTEVSITLLDKSATGIGFTVSPDFAHLISPGREIILTTGINYSIRWGRKREIGQCFGATTIE